MPIRCEDFFLLIGFFISDQFHAAGAARQRAYLLWKLSRL